MKRVNKMWAIGLIACAHRCHLVRSRAIQAESGSGSAMPWPGPSKGVPSRIAT